MSAILVAFLMLGACANKLTRTGDSTPTTAADAPKADERLVVLPKTGDDGQVGIDCVLKAVAHRGSIPAGEFRTALNPWFEPGSLPESEAELADLLGRPSVREKIASMGVRYLVVVSGETSFTHSDFGGLAGGVAVLFGSTKSSSLSFRAWDLANVKSLGIGYATATGNIIDGEVMLIPVVIYAPTEKATCEEITRRLEAIFGPGA